MKIFMDHMFDKSDVFQKSPVNPKLVGEGDNIPVHHTLEDFPFARLKNTFTRRQFFAFFIEDCLAQIKEETGKAVRDLASLGGCSFEDLMSIIPIIIPGSNIMVKENIIWAHPMSQSTPIQLLTIDPWTSFTFNRINGFETLFDIALSLEEKGWPRERARAFTRGLFLTLVDAKVCAPQTPPE